MITNVAVISKRQMVTIIILTLPAISFSWSPEHMVCVGPQDETIEGAESTGVDGD